MFPAAAGVFDAPRRSFVGNSGLSIPPWCRPSCVLSGCDDAATRCALSGVPRMHERPIGDLVDSLTQLGARVEWLGEAPGYPPLALKPATLGAERVSVRGNVRASSSPACCRRRRWWRGQAAGDRGRGELISRPYVEITLNLMERFGVRRRA